jgi:hypothetical protein
MSNAHETLNVFAKLGTVDAQSKAGRLSLRMNNSPWAIGVYERVETNVSFPHHLLIFSGPPSNQSW